MSSSNDKVPVRRPGASLTPVEPPGRASGIHAQKTQALFRLPNISLEFSLVSQAAGLESSVT